MTIMPHIPRDEFEESELRLCWRPTARRLAFHDVDSQHHRQQEPYPYHNGVPYPYVPSLDTHTPMYQGREAGHPHSHYGYHHPVPPPAGQGAPYYYHQYHSPPSCPPPASGHSAPPSDVCVPPYQSYNHQQEFMAKKNTPVVPDVRDSDVLCGRGAPTSWHPGNQYFRSLVEHYQSAYLAARRADKPEIAMRIVHTIQESGGRFLKRTKNYGAGPSGHFVWEDIGENRAYEKACQALREGAPEIRRQMLLAKEEKKRRSETRNEMASMISERNSLEEREESP